MSGMIGYGGEMSPDKLTYPRTGLRYPYKYYGGIIYRGIKRYIKRKNDWKCKINQVNNEIKALPNIGIDYFIAMHNFSSSLCKP